MVVVVEPVVLDEAVDVLEEVVVDVKVLVDGVVVVVKVLVDGVVVVAAVDVVVLVTGGSDAETGVDAAEVAVADPFRFVAVTLTRSVAPTSAEINRYVAVVSFGSSTQAPPEESQRNQSKAKPSETPVQVPGEAVSF